MARTGERCSADKLEFESWYELSAACDGENPLVLSAAIGAVVKSGGTCTAEVAGVCNSIAPIKDEPTQDIARFPIRCTIGGGSVECCVTHHFRGQSWDVCWVPIP